MNELDELQKIKKAALKWYAASEARYGPDVGQAEYIRASIDLAHALGKTVRGDPGHPKHPLYIQWAKDHPELAARHARNLERDRKMKGKV